MTGTKRPLDEEMVVVDRRTFARLRDAGRTERRDVEPHEPTISVDMAWLQREMDAQPARDVAIPQPPRAAATPQPRAQVPVAPQTAQRDGSRPLPAPTTPRPQRDAGRPSPVHQNAAPPVEVDSLRTLPIAGDSGSFRIQPTEYRPVAPRRTASAPRQHAPARIPERDLALYQAPMPGPIRTLVDILQTSAKQFPDAPAIDDGKRPLTYRDLLRAVDAAAARLIERGIGAGDRVGIRLPSGTAELYLAILATLTVGAAYVPVDADDPDERAETIWQEAGVAGVFGPGLSITVRDGVRRRGARRRPVPDDEAWIIFTSGSTGKPKGVAISHRSAAAFVDAEANLFLRRNPLRPGDRVLAGLSVAFDASCEEMWLAWRHGACLVPAPRALVKAGVELGPWLQQRRITVVSTVPTLAALWPVDALADVRLLIFGGEACPPELVERLADPRRELWNTYGPTETTVVATAAPLERGGPVRIGLPLQGWQVAVIDQNGNPVPHGEVGELVIGGIGTGRYLDPAKDAQKFRAVPALNWPRAYYSGDLVKSDGQGLLFVGRGDDQVKLGGRRIELGEVDAALLALPGVTAAAAAVRKTQAGGELLVGYLAVAGGPNAAFDLAAARTALAGRLPAALVPTLALVDTIPTRTSGKVDRKALPWPLPGTEAGASGSSDAGSAAQLPGTAGWLATKWHELLAAPVEPDSDFFALGGTSLATAQLVSTLRERFPTVSTSDIYAHPTLRALATHLDGSGAVASLTDPTAAVAVPRTRFRTTFVQSLVLALTSTITGVRFLWFLALMHNIVALVEPTIPLRGTVSWWALAIVYVVLFTAPGKLTAVMIGVRILRRGITPGDHPRGGRVHLQLWACEKLVSVFGIRSLAGTPWAARYARALGCEVGKGVELHTTVPVTGFAELGHGCTVESGVDMAGWWIDGDVLRIGQIRVGVMARVATRSILLPGADIGAGAEIEGGSRVDGRIAPWEVWAGSPAEFVGLPDRTWPAPVERSTFWSFVYSVSLFGIGAFPFIAGLPGFAFLLFMLHGQTQVVPLLTRLVTYIPAGVGISVLSYVLVTALSVRFFGLGLKPGVHRVDSYAGWCAWMTEGLISGTRAILFPLYAGLITPWWLRLLGAHIGKGVEASTVTGIPKFIYADDKSFLADDTLVAPSEIRGGWVRFGPARVGKRAFAGNSGIVAPGRQIHDDSLIAVLSSAPAVSAPGTSWLEGPPARCPAWPRAAATSRAPSTRRSGSCSLA